MLALKLSDFMQKVDEVHPQAVSWVLVQTHCTTHCNTRYKTLRNKYCNAHCNTHCNAHCNTHCITPEVQVVRWLV